MSFYCPFFKIFFEREAIVYFDPLPLPIILIPEGSSSFNNLMYFFTIPACHLSNIMII